MENKINYENCVKKLLSEYSNYKTDWSDIELIFDDTRKHYLIVRVGWYNQKRIHSCLIHINICGDNIVIQENNTENLLDKELINMGISEDKIIFGFLPPEVQQMKNAMLSF